MIINLRYHIASLVAVFLALGIGILVGSIIMGNNALEEQQQQLADRLEKHLTDLRRENELVRQQLGELEAVVDRQKNFAESVFPYLVAEQLKDYNIAIIETGEDAAWQELEVSLEIAGANVQSYTVFKDWTFEGVDKDAVLRLRGWDHIPDTKLVAAIAAAVAQDILSGSSPLIEYLEQENFLMRRGEYGHPIDAVVIVAGDNGGKERLRNLDLKIIQYFRQHDIPVYGVERSDITKSCMREYQQVCVATVDNIDQIPGRFALVMALAGRNGHYGIKDSAQNLIPVFGGTEGLNVNG
ncbi:MAG: copper transporter [Peptococcaceae bacterium]|nr:copper transporter [Peptococcaceae bacterium]